MAKKKSYLTGAVTITETPQSEPIPGRELDMADNSAGGYTFTVDDFKRAERFLILGSEGGSYYASQKVLTKENARAVIRAIKDDGRRVVKMVRDISVGGRAPKNDTAIFTLAMAASVGDAATKAAALAALPEVCRIGTHLFQFAEFIDAGKLRGWGRALRTAIGQWYLDKPAEKLAYQAVKYQQRNGWSHKDLLRLAHPKVLRGDDASIIRWIVKGEVPTTSTAGARLIGAFEEAKTADKLRVVRMIREVGLTREMIPTEHLNDADVWAALLEKMPMTAMIRNLGKLSQVGLLAPLSDASELICSRLGDGEALRRARVHPVAIFMAMKTYASGHGLKGSLEWTVVPQVVDALNEAFYKAFGNIRSTGKRFYLGVDVSGSMDGGCVAGIPDFTPREAAGLMAMVTARSEEKYYCAGFSDGSRVPKATRGRTLHYSSYTPAMELLDISPKDRLNKICKVMQDVPMGGTDCALPMLDALHKKIPVDCFVIYTDSETWAGDIQPVQALKKYREQMGIPAKLVVQGFVSNEFSIADPYDAGMLDVVGMDTAAPQIISDFASGGSVVADPGSED